MQWYVFFRSIGFSVADAVTASHYWKRVNCDITIIALPDMRRAHSCRQLFYGPRPY